jgi:hypothetical protein
MCCAALAAVRNVQALALLLVLCSMRGVVTGAQSDSSGGLSASRPSHRSHASSMNGGAGQLRVDTGAREGLAVGHASVRDARLAVYIILLGKYRLDGAALKDAGGCKVLQKVRLPLPAPCSAAAVLHCCLLRAEATVAASAIALYLPQYLQF